MKYLKQLLIILLVSCIGEILNYFIPLPIPASIYGLIIMILLLISKKLRLEAVKETAEFLIDIMPVMFIPAAVGLIAFWKQLQPILIPVCVMILTSTILVMVATGKTTDYILKKEKNKDE